VKTAPSEWSMYWSLPLAAMSQR